MRTVIQRVARARVSVAGETVGAIDEGLLLLVGVEQGDGETEVELSAKKIADLRCFPGRTPMDKSVVEVGGALLVVSQFTLCASLGKGNRPDFTRAAPPAEAERLYELLVARLRARGLTVATGRFRAEMAVELVNDGPVTFVWETRRAQ